MTPTTQVPAGRDPATGRLLPGHKLSKGNPHQKKVAALRSEMFQAVTRQDMRDVIRALVDKAKEGNVPAVRELLDRVFGKAQQHVSVEGSGLFSSYEQRQLLIQVLTGSIDTESQDTPRLVDPDQAGQVIEHEVPLPDTPAHYVI